MNSADETSTDTATTGSENGTGRSDTAGAMPGIKITAMDYLCRVCATPKKIHISPIERVVEGEDALVIDADGYHRVTVTECRECETDRTHVIQPEGTYE